MAVKKVNGFAAPYRSQTFQNMADSLARMNAIMEMSGNVTQTGSVATVPPFRFIQNGLLVTKDSQTLVTVPSGLQAPYMMTVTAPTPRDVDDLVFGFAKSPKDVTSDEVIVAYFDGVEWRQAPSLSMAGLNEVIKSDRTPGPISGVKTSLSGGVLTVSPGTLYDGQGDRVDLSAPHLFPVIPQDPNYSRVDRIVYRRAKDSPFRVGSLELIAGGAFDLNGVGFTYANTLLSDSTNVNNRVKVLVCADNTVVTLVSVGYGDFFQIKLTKFGQDRLSVLAQAMVTTATESEFDAVLDSSGNLYIAFIDEGKVKIQKASTSGVTSGSAFLATASFANPMSEPRLAIDYKDTLYVVFKGLMGPLNHQHHLTTLLTDGSQVRSPVRLQNDLLDYGQASVGVTDDLLVYLAYAELSSGSVYYTVLNEAGQTSISPVLVSGSTDGGSYGTLVNNAKLPQIRVADNKELFVFFLQRKGASTYGLSTWSEGSAKLFDLFSSAENLKCFDVAVDPLMNQAHLVLGDAAGTFYVQVRNGSSYLTHQIYTNGSDFVAIQKDLYGSLFHARSAVQSGSYTLYGSPQTASYIGPALITGSLNSVTLEANQIAIPSLVSCGVGERMTVSDSAGGTNNGDRVVTAISSVSINAASDFKILTVTPDFLSAEDPCLSTKVQFATPDGNSAHGIKSVAEISRAAAYETDLLDTDVLLARVQGGNILNYIPLGDVLNTDRLGIDGNGSVVDWAKTTPGSFTITGGPLAIYDLVNFYKYSVQSGSYPIAEDECVYVQLPPGAPNLTISCVPTVAHMHDIPWGDNTVVLAFRKGDRINPVFLQKGNVQPLDNGEQGTVGQDLPQSIRTKLGITSETTFEPFSSTSVVSNSDTMPAAVSKLDDRIDGLENGLSVVVHQNQNIRLIGGGTWSWNSNALFWSGVAQIAVPGLNGSSNQFPASAIALDDGDVAYVDISRDPLSSAILTVSKAQSSALDLTGGPAKDNRIIFARRSGSVCYLGVGATLTAMLPGESHELAYKLSDQTRTLLGANITQATSDPDYSSRGAPLRALSNSEGFAEAITNIDVELDKLFGQCRLKALGTRVSVTGADRSMRTGETIGLELGGMRLSFSGAQVDFASGSVFASDGTTVLGDSFIGTASLANNGYRWYSISVVPSTVGSDNSISGKLLVIPASSDGTSAANAPKSVFTTGRKLGMVLVSKDSAGSLRVIQQPDIVQLGVGSGSGGGGASFTVVGLSPWSWVTPTLSTTSSCYVMVPGLPDNRNEIAAQDIYLNNDGDVAYVEINRTTGSAATLTVQVAPVGSIMLKENTVIIARRVGSTVVLNDGTSLLSGSIKRLGRGLTEQSEMYIGLQGETDDSPDYTNAHPSSSDNSYVVDGENLTRAIKRLDNALDPGCRLLSLGSKRVKITGATRTLIDGTISTRPLSSLELDFEGAQVDFETGQVFGADGVTVLSTFTPIIPASGMYQWVSLALIPDVVSLDNRMTAQVLVQAGPGTEPYQGLAPRAPYATGAINLGQVCLQGSGSGIQTISQSNIAIAVGAGSSGDDSTGIGASLEPASGFKAIVYDTFDEAATSSNSSVDSALTNATYSTTKKMYSMACDKSKTVTTSGFSYTLSSAPSFTVKAGDIIYSGGTWRNIVGVSTQTTGTLDAVFPTNLSGASAMVSQAVWTKDLVNLGDATEMTRLSDIYPGGSVPSISLYYEDSVAPGDGVANVAESANVVAAASPAGPYSSTLPVGSADFSSIYRRPAVPNQILDYVQDAPHSTKQRLFLVFFPDPTNSAVTTNANLLYFEASLYGEDTHYSGGIINSAYGMTNGASGSAQNGISVSTSTETYGGVYYATVTAGSTLATLGASSADLYSWASSSSGFSISGSVIPSGASVLGFVGANQITLSTPATMSGTSLVSFTKGITLVELGFDYVPGLNSGKPDGDLEVFVDGLLIPRYYPGVNGTYYKEDPTSTKKISISTDFTSKDYSIQVRRRVGTIDSYDSNRSKINLMVADAVVGTSEQVLTGVATHSSIQSAINSAASGSKIFILPGTYTENLTISKSDITIEGKGRLSIINGNVSMSGSGNQVLGIKVSGNLDLTGSDYSFVRCWLGSSATFTAGGLYNSLNIIQE